MDSAAGSGVRQAEVVAALSLATDLAMAQPMEVALRSCVLAMRLGEACGLSDADLADAYWYALLRYVGCNAESQALAALVGDELAFRRGTGVTDMGRPAEVVPLLFGALRRAQTGVAPLPMIAAVTHGLLTGAQATRAMIDGHCDVADRLAARLGLAPSVRRAIGQIYERWDGRGLPHRLKAEAVVPAVRVVNLAQDAVLLGLAFGEDTARAKLKSRRGTAYEPKVVDCFLAGAATLTAGLDQASCWNAVLDLEPEPRLWLTVGDLDEALLAMADFADLKTPYSFGHSRAVAGLAGEAARRFGLPRAEADDVGRAGLVHDIGQIAVSAGALARPGPLTAGEWEQVRLHPYFAERVLARPVRLARFGAIAGQHHERLDGSGYHRAVRADGLTPHGRVLAAVEAYVNMTEPRPYRAALAPESAALKLKDEARHGRLDGDAVVAVLAAAGHRVPSARHDRLAGLTDREAEILRLVAGGQSMKAMARRLGLSPKTVDNHLQHLYPKIGVNTRAGAMLFAIEHGLAVTAPA